MGKQACARERPNKEGPRRSEADARSGDLFGPYPGRTPARAPAPLERTVDGENTVMQRLFPLPRRPSSQAACLGRAHNL